MRGVVESFERAKNRVNEANQRLADATKKKAEIIKSLQSKLKQHNKAIKLTSLNSIDKKKLINVSGKTSLLTKSLTQFETQLKAMAQSFLALRGKINKQLSQSRGK